jgi:AraC-like DNA-binding protein
MAMRDDALAGARTSEERIAGIQSFLLRHLRPHNDSLANHAALHLGKDPTMQIHPFAAKLGCSSRHLVRAFNAIFGIGPKRFARLPRFHKLFAERRPAGRGRKSPMHVAGRSGTPRQGVPRHRWGSPTEFFMHELRMGAEGMDEANLLIQRPGPTDRPVTKP